MATEITAGPLPHIHSATTVGGGTALSTTTAYIPFLPKTRWVSMTAINAATPATDVAQINLMPWLTILKTADALATAPTDYSSEAQDGSTSTSVTLSDFDTAANDNYLYIGSHVPFRALYCDVDGVNSNTAVLTVKYWKSDSTWTSISATDNTSSGGVTLAQDGTITWTVPSDWKVADLKDTGDSTIAGNPGYGPKYWLRCEVNAALDAAVTIDALYGLNQSSTFGELADSQSIEGAVTNTVGGWSGVEAKSDVTINLIINCAQAAGGL